MLSGCEVQLTILAYGLINVESGETEAWFVERTS
jgi:hypothetical protein